MVLLLAFGGLVSVGEAPSTALATPAADARVVSAHESVAVQMGAVVSSGRASSTPTPTPVATAGTAADEPPSSSHKVLVYGLALVTGLLALLAMARRGRSRKQP